MCLSPPSAATTVYRVGARALLATGPVTACHSSDSGEGKSSLPTYAQTPKCGIKLGQVGDNDRAQSDRSMTVTANSNDPSGPPKPSKCPIRRPETSTSTLSWQVDEMRDIALSTKDAARYLGLSPKTLANARVVGGEKGPRFVKGPGVRGFVRYPISELRRYRDSLMRCSTRDDGSHVVGSAIDEQR